MSILIIGLILFLGVHSVRIVAEPWRTAQIARRGEGAWKGIFTVLSIAGFVVALGLLVDDSIVVVENIARHVREGMPRRQAAIGATHQIWLAVLGCTATLLLAFLPLLFPPEASGEFVRSLPAAVLHVEKLRSQRWVWHDEWPAGKRIHIEKGI